ncbi:hypothetical protein HBI56_235270 [Parastagonospora nodorum]|nr:hypothetical protein HBH52_218070 [Parastagonospora nodorum]KAH4252148.1 hypothetical protein HBI03_214630 [Parastagonospora nodorum]KAH4334437.1 hypothetical protein HBH98_240970 [Parastagonospora nodorum]KAH4891455.1 hypothetical protein HBH74_224140 [Parastagonospora nodorum]KAH4952681.1 hypothetical protein HBI78_237150 [Parastagonospora nodorum]
MGANGTVDNHFTNGFNEPGVPRYHKMKFLMLLASALEDYEVRALLDTCDRILQQGRDELDAEDGVEDSMLLDDQGTADAQGMMENMDIGTEEDNEAGRAKKDRAEESSGAGKVNHLATWKTRTSTDLPIAGCSVGGLGRETRHGSPSKSAERGPATGIPVHIPSCSRDHAGKCAQQICTEN